MSCKKQGADYIWLAVRWHALWQACRVGGRGWTFGSLLLGGQGVVVRNVM